MLQTLSPQLPKPIIVDNFYDSPIEIRNFALSCNFRHPPLTGTESLVSRQRHPETEATLQKIAAIVKARPNIAEINRMRGFWDFGACGEFQLRLESLPSLGKIHSHPYGQWVGIVYLSEGADCKDRLGTLLYQHKETKLYHYSQVDEEKYQVLQKDSRTHEKWDLVYQTPLIFNRLLLFDSRYFHCESQGFGQSAENGRLIQIFNFKDDDRNSKLDTA